MNQCRNTIRRIQETGARLDRESIEHCLACPSCRRELLARLAAEDPAAPPVPATLDRNVLTHCADGRAFKRRRILRRSLAWSGGAAAAAAVFAAYLGIAGIAPRDTVHSIPAVNPEWDGSALFRAIADIDAELGNMEELLTIEKERVEI